MTKNYLTLAFALCSFALTSWAQTPDSLRNTAETTWRDTGPKMSYGLAVVKTKAGKTVHTYFPVNSIGFEKTISYFKANPEVRSFPRIQHVNVVELASATIRGHHLENMQAASCPDVLALRLLEGPVELFAVSGTVGDKVPLIFLPLNPGISLLAGMAALGSSAMERNRWFLRRDGKLVAVTHGNFRSLMTEYTADCLALSVQIKEGTAGFHYRDMPEIVRLYNEFLQKDKPK